MEKEELNKIIDERIKQVLKTSAFTDRKPTDTPTDANQTVPRKYVTLNGTSALRPTASVVGQHYFDTSLASGRGKPVYWNGIGFVDATGSYV